MDQTIGMLLIDRSFRQKGFFFLFFALSNSLPLRIWT